MLGICHLAMSASWRNVCYKKSSWVLLLWLTWVQENELLTFFRCFFLTPTALSGKQSSDWRRALPLRSYRRLLLKSVRTIRLVMASNYSIIIVSIVIYYSFISHSMSF